ncbi:TerB N-terminal domain-containing protein [Raoultibacter phocaeensis]|uniref:TerB N-terminal domain-containing protein n=1 Tax=Raoultibacter phocaeensis TaxID=2479841 RepID=UPI0015D5F0EE|nr:TerB N-terminal domain-containing protein [Raoultibacter phocaeensis]
MGSAQLIYGLDSDQGYKPCPIPPHRDMSPKPAPGTVCVVQTSEPTFDDFAEISLGGHSNEADQDVQHVYGRPVAQAIEPDDDATRAAFRELRHIAQQGVWYRMDKTEVFYRQARLMESFIDDYEGAASLSCYYPRYQKMDYSQLRTYFTWRTAAREGVFKETSTSFAFLYLYELINGVGADGPLDGLEKLTATWFALRADLPVLDRYVPGWIKDYCVYYPLDTSFREFALQNNLQRHYPTVFCYGTEGTEAFELYARIASYDIEKSVFFTEDHRDMIVECFGFVLTRLRERFAEKKRRFEDSVFSAERRASRWSPFGKALFYPTLAQPRRTVRISEKEVYECEAGRWTAKRVALAPQGPQLAGYLMKATEAHLRKAVRFKHRLTANLDSFKAVDQGSFERIGLSVPRVVEEACTEFYEHYTFRSVSVNLDSLKRIRTDALSTQEKLVVPDAEDIRAASSVEATPPPTAPADPSFPEAHGTEQQTAWQRFALSLTEAEREALEAVLAGGDVKQVAQTRAIMLEVLLDGINEKAMDSLGDAVVETDDSISVYEDYEYDLRKAMDA